MYNKVRYIGKPDFCTEALIGIELDHWSANARDGSIHGQQIFETSEGRGFFAPLRSVVNVTAKCKVTEGGFARLQGLVRVTQFNGKTVEIVCYVEKKGRWKVKLLHSHAKSEKKYLGVKEENLDPILVWEPLIDPNRPRKESLEECPEIDDQVETRDGHIGIVKYVGSVEFAGDDDSDDDELWIGLSLEEWDPNGHNGTVKHKTYFEAKQGRGYFVTLDQLIENVGSEQASTELENNVETNIQN